MRFRSLADQLGIREGRGADHDTVNAKRKPAIDRRAVADSAAKLHLAFERLQYAFDGLGVDGATGKGPVQIDDMQMGGVLLVEKLCLTRRIIGIDGGAIHIAFGKADDLPAFKINGWKEIGRASCRERVCQYV